MTTAQAMRNVDETNVIELPDNFAGNLGQNLTGQVKGERLEDACRVETAYCAQAIADTRRKESADLTSVAERRAELDREEAAIKATAESEVTSLTTRQRRAQAYLAG